MKKGRRLPGKRTALTHREHVRRVVPRRLPIELTPQNEPIIRGMRTFMQKCVERMGDEKIAWRHRRVANAVIAILDAVLTNAKVLVLDPEDAVLVPTTFHADAAVASAIEAAQRAAAEEEARRRARYQSWPMSGAYTSAAVIYDPVTGLYRIR